VCILCILCILFFRNIYFSLFPDRVVERRKNEKHHGVGKERPIFRGIQVYIVYTSFFVLCSDQKTTSQEPVPEYFYYKFYRQIKCRSRLPEEWQLIDEADKGHLEEGDRCRQLCLKLVTVLEVSRMSGTEACMG
jgi:hypothetical protein